MRGGWKVRGGQLIPSKGPEWMGIHHHEQDIGLPCKWGFFLRFLVQGVMPRIIDYVCVKIKIEFLCAG